MEVNAKPRVPYQKRNYILGLIKKKFGTTTSESIMIFNYAGNALTWEEAYSMLEGKLSKKTRSGERLKMRNNR